MTDIVLKLPDTLAAKLDGLAKKLAQSRNSVATHAIETFVDQQFWQMEEIEAALEEAERGDFTNPEDVKKIFEKYNIKTKN